MKNKIAEFIQAGDIENLKKALNNNPDFVNGKTEQGISFLTFAAYCRNNEAIDLIKENKSKLDIYERIIIGDLLHTKEYLVNNLTLLNQYSVDGFTPIGLASFFGHYKIAEILLEKGANVNITSNNDFKVSPLHSACAISNLK